MGKTLQELKGINAGTLVHRLVLDDDGYPYYFIGEEFVGWAEYIDFSVFDPFEIVGFETIYHSAEIDGKHLGEQSYESLNYKMESIVCNDSKPFSEVLSELKGLGPVVRVSARKIDPETHGFVDAREYS